MLSPFPGMEKKQEKKNLWTEVHHRLISTIAVAPSLHPKYRVAIAKRVYLSNAIQYRSCPSDRTLPYPATIATFAMENLSR